MLFRSAAEEVRWDPQPAGPVEASAHGEAETLPAADASPGDTGEGNDSECPEPPPAVLEPAPKPAPNQPATEPEPDQDQLPESVEVEILDPPPAQRTVPDFQAIDALLSASGALPPSDETEPPLADAELEPEEGVSSAARPAPPP